MAEWIASNRRLRSGSSASKRSCPDQILHKILSISQISSCKKWQDKQWHHFQLSAAINHCKTITQSFHFLADTFLTLLRPSWPKKNGKWEHFGKISQKTLLKTWSCKSLKAVSRRPSWLKWKRARFNAGENCQNKCHLQSKSKFGSPLATKSYKYNFPFLHQADKNIFLTTGLPSMLCHSYEPDTWSL